MQEILQPLGFLHLFCGVTQPNLLTFRDRYSSYLQFINLMYSAKRTGQHINTSISTVLKVLCFLKAHSSRLGMPYSQQLTTQHNTQVHQLQSLKMQLTGITWVPKPDSQQWREEGGWLEAGEMVALVENMKSKAVGLLAELAQLDFLDASHPNPIPEVSSTADCPPDS